MKTIKGTNIIELTEENEEVFSMATLLPKRSKLSVPLYIDDSKSYQRGRHPKRIKFKPNNNIDDSRFWTTMWFDGTIDESTVVGKMEVSSKERREISNFVKNNEYILNLIADENIDIYDFINVMIPGGEPATEEQKAELKRKVDELL